MIQKTLLIGLNDKNTLKQEIKTSQAIKKIKQVLFYHGFNYITLNKSQGCYIMQETQDQIQETSIQVVIIEDFKSTLKHIKSINRAIEDLKQVLNQESIGLCYSFIKASFK